MKDSTKLLIIIAIMIIIVVILLVVFVCVGGNNHPDEYKMLRSNKLSHKNKHAICFGGGGWTAATGELSLINYLCGVKRVSVKELLKNVSTATGNSGGTYSLLLLFYSDTFNKNHLDYDDKFSTPDSQASRIDSFYDGMKQDVTLWEVLGLFDTNRSDLNWTNLLNKGLNKYGPEITDRFLDDLASAGTGKEIIFNTTVNSKGILHNAKGTTISGTGNIIPNKIGETIVVDSKITVPTIKRKEGDPLNTFAQVRFIGVEGTSKQKQPIFVFPGKIESSIEINDNKFGTHTSKVIQTNTVKMGDTLYDISKVRAIDAAGASSSFFGLVENPDFLKELSNDVITQYLGKNIASDIFKVISNDSQLLFKPGITMAADIKNNDVTLSPLGDQNTQIEKDIAYLKFCDGGYIDNSGIATTLKHFQDNSNITETLKITYIDGASDHPGKDWVWGSIVDHIFGIDKRTFTDYGGLWDQRWPPGSKASKIPFPMPTIYCMNINKMTYTSGLLSNKYCKAYNRGPPYSWKWGDRPFSKDEDHERCLKDNPQGCDYRGMGWYPKCKNGTKAGILPWQCSCPSGVNTTKEETWMRFTTFECTTVENPWFGIKPGQKVSFSYYQTNASGTSMLPINLDVGRVDVSDMFQAPKKCFREVSKIIEDNEEIKQKLLEMFF